MRRHKAAACIPSPFRDLFAAPAAVLCAVDSVAAAVAAVLCAVYLVVAVVDAAAGFYPPPNASVVLLFLQNLLLGCRRRGSNFQLLFSSSFNSLRLSGTLQGLSFASTSLDVAG